MTQKVVIVGAGALGSHLVLLLRNIAPDVVVIDGDRVEARNVLSQFHAQHAVGKNKVVGLQGLMQFCWGVKISPTPHMLTRHNASVLLGGSKLVVDCTDNLEARQLIQEQCRERKIACLHGALAADGVYGRVCWSERFRADAAEPGVPTCEDGEQLPFIALTAAYLARAAQEFLRTGKRAGYEITLGGAFRTEG